MRRIAFVSALVLAFVSARQRAIHPAPPPVGPTFSKEVSRIFQANCQTCHHPGDIGPFSLMTYADAYPHASDIKYMTQTHQMPPWKPAQSCGIFDSPRILSQPDIDTLAKWAGNGAPEGNRADLPPAHPLEIGCVLPSAVTVQWSSVPAIPTTITAGTTRSISTPTTRRMPF